MKHPIYAVFVVLGLIGLCSQPTYAEGDDSGHTPTKRVDVKTRLMKASLTRSTYGIEGKDWNVAQTTEIRTRKFHAPTPRFHPLAATISTKELHEQIIGPRATAAHRCARGQESPQRARHAVAQGRGTGRRQRGER